MMAHAIQLLRDTSVASIAPTSGQSVKRISRLIAFESARVIVEFGPGDGALTKMLLRRMRQDALLIAIETNEHFVSILKKDFRDQRLKVIHDSAENVVEILSSLGLDKVDYIVSGIPFSFFPMPLKVKIARAASSILRSDGSFVIYQALTAPLGGVALKKALSNFFDIVYKETLWLNLPPLYLWETKKNYNIE